MKVLEIVTGKYERVVLAKGAFDVRWKLHFLKINPDAEGAEGAALKDIIIDRGVPMETVQNFLKNAQERGEKVIKNVNQYDAGFDAYFMLSKDFLDLIQELPFE